MHWSIYCQYELEKGEKVFGPDYGYMDAILLHPGFCTTLQSIFKFCFQEEAQIFAHLVWRLSSSSAPKKNETYRIESIFLQAKQILTFGLNAFIWKADGVLRFCL